MLAPHALLEEIGAALLRTCRYSAFDFRLRSRAGRRPQASGMHQGQDPDGVGLHLVDQPIAFMSDQFAGRRELSAPSYQGVLGQSADGCLENLIHADGRERVVPGDEVDDVGAVLLGG